MKLMDLIYGGYRQAPVLLMLLIISEAALAQSSFQEVRQEPVLRTAQVAAAESDGQAWRRRGTQLLQAGRREEALDAYRKAEAMGAGDEQLTMDIAQLYRDIGNDRKAYWEYRKNRFANDPEIQATACEAMEELKYERTKTLPRPYFADLEASGGWQSIEDTTFIDMKARFGVAYGEVNPVEYYLFGRVSRDNRSGIVGDFPEQYFDNVAIFGVGVRKYLMEDLGLTFLAEAGWARDLIDLARDRERSDTRAGFQMYKEWFTAYDCRSKDRYPNRFILSTWAELMYYSRYDDAWLFSADLRPGIRMYESEKSNVDAFLLFAGAVDSTDDNEFEYKEAGVGLSWTPDRQIDFKVTAKASEIYYEGGASDKNYTIQFEYYGLW